VAKLILDESEILFDVVQPGAAGQTPVSALNHGCVTGSSSRERVGTGAYPYGVTRDAHIPRCSRRCGREPRMYRTPLIPRL